MKAAIVNSFKGSSSFEIIEKEEPTPKEGQVLVDVKAASINPFDVKVLQGSYGEMGLKFPFVWGGDFSGVVRDTGEEIFGSAMVLNGGSGTYAQVVAVNNKNSAKKPSNTIFEESGALPLVGSSAVQALEDHIKLQGGHKILIHGGAGGIGHIAIQVAKAIGAHVATTVSTKDIEFVKNLGADEIIDYKTQQFEDMVSDYDAVFDTVGPSTWEGSFKILKDGGTFVSMLGEPKSEEKNKNITTIGQSSQTNSEHLEKIAKYVEEGKVKVHIDKVFPLDQIKEAFEYQENSKPRGKVVIKIS